MNNAAASVHPSFVGLPLGAWAFALRIWLAMTAALYAAFWLQLESASSAAVCVGILALPTRGQAYEKAIYRIGGTLAGGVASIVIAGLFNETRDLFILAFAAWMGLCAYVAGRLDGNRAYGVVLSGYTVAIVAVANIDAPQAVFLAGANRIAAILVGVASIMLFNDCLAAPDTFPDLLGKLEAARKQVLGFASDALRRGEVDPFRIAMLLKTITALRPDVSTLPSESIHGGARSASAAQALAAMTREIAAVRAAGVMLKAMSDAGHARGDALAAALDNLRSPAAQRIERMLDDDIDAGGPASPRFIAASAAKVVLRQHRTTLQALDDMRHGRGPDKAPRLPIYRDRRAAARTAIRTFLAVALSAAFFVLSGWPSTSFGLSLLGAIAGISAVSPSPRQTAVYGVVAILIAVLLAGVTQFVILDGVSAFPLLALGMAPSVLGAALLIGSGVPRLAPLGLLLLIYFPVLLSPANPQPYNPQAFLTNSILAITGVTAYAIALATILPTTDAMKRASILRSLREDFQCALGRSRTRLSAPEIAFRDADRIGQLVRPGQERVPDCDSDLTHALRAAALNSAAWRTRAALANPSLPSGFEQEGRRALASCDPAALRRCAQSLLVRQGLTQTPVQASDRRWAAATMGWMAALIESSPLELDTLGGALVQ